MADTRYRIYAEDRASKVVDRVGDSFERGEKKIHAFGRAGVTAGGKFRGAVGLMAKGATGLGVGVAAMAVAAGPKLLDMGVSVEAMGNKARTVFGGSLPVVTKWADTASAKMGLTSTQAAGLVAGLGDLLTPMGFTQRQAAAMSTKIADLSGAFAQWSNGTLDSSAAADMLSAALTGEYDSLKSVGVQIDADTVKTLLHKAGKDKLTGAALKQATAEVVLKEITRQSSNAISAYTGGTNKLAIAKNKLTSQVNTLKERFVTALIPAMTTAATWAGQHLPGAAAATVHAFQNTVHAGGNVVHAFGNVVHAGGNVIHAVGNIVHAGENFAHASGNVIHAGGNVVHALGNIVHAGGNVVHFFQVMPGTILEAFRGAAGWLPRKGREILGGLWAGMKAAWVAVKGWFAALPGAFLRAIGIQSPPGWAISAGRHIMGGLLKGLAGGAPDVKAFFTSRVMNVFAGWQAGQAGARFGIPSAGAGNPNYYPSYVYGPVVDLGQRLAAAWYGWTGRQWTALKSLWDRESGWNPLADNPTSTAFGIPQFLASTAKAYGVYGSTDPTRQIIAGMRYISDRYGNPVNALAAWSARSPHWYGGGLPPTVFESPTLIGVGERGAETVSVTPGRPQPAGRVNVYEFHFHGPVYGDEQALVRRLRAALRAMQQREGVPAGQQVR